MPLITCDLCSKVVLTSQSFSRYNKMFCSKLCMNKGCATELAVFSEKEENKAKTKKQVQGTYQSFGGFC